PRRSVCRPSSAPSWRFRRTPSRWGPGGSVRRAPSPRRRRWSTPSSTRCARSTSAISTCRSGPSGCGEPSTEARPAIPDGGGGGVSSNTMESSLRVRKYWLTVDETWLVAGRDDGAGPRRKVAACAIVENPLAGQGYVEDLTPLVTGSRVLGHELGRRAGALLGSPVESYGKAAIVGIAGE